MRPEKVDDGVVASSKPASEKSASDKSSDNVNVGVLRSANRLLDEMVGPLQIKRQVLSEMIRFFHRQPPAVRRVMLNDVDPDMEHAYAQMLRRMADKLDPPSAPPPPPAKAGVKAGAPAAGKYVAEETNVPSWRDAAEKMNEQSTAPRRRTKK